MVIDLADFIRALDNDELVPHFQPIVELRTGRLSGFEVLARWNHPTRGPLLPPNLIAVAEENGLIGSLTHKIFQKAFSTIAVLPEPIRLSVNLSPVQLSYASLPRQLEDLAAETNFPLSRLTIEITESALLHGLTKSQAIAAQLKELGCRLSLDDFGTGYSSLSHLQALPFNELKIDRSFVHKMTSKRESRKIVAAIVGLGHSLGMSTVAEGVETEEQADMLLWLGSELGQGWLYGRPAAVEKIPELAAAPPRPAAVGVATPGDDWSVSSLEAFPTQRLAQLQAIYDGAPVGLCFLDCSLRYVSMNRKLAEMNGASVAAHLGRTVKEMIPHSYADYEPYFLSALNGQAISGVEVPRRGIKAGAPDWISLCSYQPAFDEVDEVIGVSVSVMDVTEHKQAQNALRESRSLQEHRGELAARITWVMDAEGHNLQSSSEWVKTVSGTKDPIRNLGWLEALHLDDLKATIRTMKQALRTGEPIDIEYRVKNTRGKWRWVRSHGTPRFGAQGEITRWCGTVVDIHEKKMADEKLHKAEAKLHPHPKPPAAPPLRQAKRRPPPPQKNSLPHQANHA